MTGTFPPALGAGIQAPGSAGVPTSYLPGAGSLPPAPPSPPALPVPLATSGDGAAASTARPPAPPLPAAASSPEEPPPPPVAVPVPPPPFRPQASDISTSERTRSDRG